MGRLAYKHSSLMSVNDGDYIGYWPMPADVRWTATVVCHSGGGSLQPDPAGNEAIEMALHVNASPVLEIRLSPGVTDYDALVIPWGDGLIFSQGEQVGWYVINTTSNGDFTAVTFLGEQL